MTGASAGPGRSLDLFLFCFCFGMLFCRPFSFHATACEGREEGVLYFVAVHSGLHCDFWGETDSQTKCQPTSWTSHSQTWNQQNSESALTTESIVV